MQLAQAGQFYGPTGIEEYVRYADNTSPFVKNYLELDQNAVVSTASDPTTGECVVLVSGIVSYELDDTAALYQVHSLGFFFKIFFEPKGIFAGVTISRVNVFFDERFLDDFFHRLLNTPQTRLSLCSIMETNCPNTWDFNGLESSSECVGRMDALPNTEGAEFDFTGNTQACRIVHAAIARINDFHCPHISFDPQEDADRQLKCQESSGVLPSELFTNDELQVFRDRVEVVGFEDGFPYFICDCNNLSLMERLYRLLQFRTGWAFFNNLVPLPVTWFPLGGLFSIPKCSLC